MVLISEPSPAQPSPNLAQLSFGLFQIFSQMIIRKSRKPFKNITVPLVKAIRLMPNFSQREIETFRKLCTQWSATKRTNKRTEKREKYYSFLPFCSVWFVYSLRLMRVGSGRVGAPEKNRVMETGANEWVDKYKIGLDFRTTFVQMYNIYICAMAFV